MLLVRRFFGEIQKLLRRVMQVAGEFRHGVGDSILDCDIVQAEESLAHVLIGARQRIDLGLQLGNGFFLAAAVRTLGKTNLGATAL